MGPSIIFDKSTLQGLSLDESVWLHLHYRPNLTPVFLVEALADLSKDTRKGRRPEDEVARLAAKSTLRGDPLNAFHEGLGAAELRGPAVEMKRIPVISADRALSTANGTGVIFLEAPEAQAMARWRQREFLEVEKLIARKWRSAINSLDLSGYRTFISGTRPRTLAEARDLAYSSIDRDGARLQTLRTAVRRFAMPRSEWPRILRRWKGAGGPRLREFAPFAAHVLTVDTFFGLCLGADLISDRRPSNGVDIAYLYYLPFCRVFSSNDHLHRKVVPLFLGDDQVFLPGAELKSDLAALNAHYLALPEHIRAEGAMRFARYPPTTGDFLTARLWDKFRGPSWRRDAEVGPMPLTEPQKSALKDLVKRFEAIDPAPAGSNQPNLDTAGAVIFESRIPVQVGNWRIVPPGVEDEHDL